MAARQVVVPVALQKKVMQKSHDDPICGGHFGRDKTLGKIRTRYWWPGMYQDITFWINSCDVCRPNRTRKPVKAGRLESITVGEAFHTVSVDVLQMGRRTKRGNRYIFVYVDYLTKWATAYVSLTQTATDAAKGFMETIILVHGCPMRLLSDRGSNFLSAMMQELYKLLKIRKVNITA